ncbi:type 1 glutamine amidotransferase domain-containing protein [Trichlorobacter lovleyi]|uniref:type 1 glutamine amidotransferase domain-containing protein n=1 Tax=Trichlorobacter lovleyi TaxID=313985 RepID=UPI0023F523F3|nr:type 1 glutamine amidotransferase domain-containing protein [Trichlorobacter lovleyi]
MKRVVIITATNFQDEEFVYPYYRLLEEGYTVAVATPGKENCTGKYGVPSRPTMDTADLRVDDFDAVILPGGFEAPDRLRIRKEVLEFVRGMSDQGKLVAAICHGPWICISAQIVRGRKMTGYIAVSDDLRNAGAEYIEADVVVDGNLITAPHYRNNGDFMKAVIAAMNSAA